MKKLNKWICKKFGHKFNDIEMLMFEIEAKAVNYEAFKDETIQCKRCKALFGHKKGINS